MPFDPSVISEVTHAREGSRLTLEWTSTAPAGTWFQLYLQGALAWWGTERHVTIAAPRGLTDGQIGAVANGEQTTDFGGFGFGRGVFGLGGFGLDGLLQPAIKTRAYLAWTGFGASHYGVFEGSAGFGLGGFGQGQFGDALLATVAAVEQGLSTSGFGASGFGADGFAASAGAFHWTSAPLTQGTWRFVVVPYDAANNPGTSSTITVAITTPPRPPAPNSSGKRLTYTYNVSVKQVTLNWLASPG